MGHEKQATYTLSISWRYSGAQIRMGAGVCLFLRGPALGTIDRLARPDAVGRPGRVGLHRRATGTRTQPAACTGSGDHHHGGNAADVGPGYRCVTSASADTAGRRYVARADPGR